MNELPKPSWNGWLWRRRARCAKLWLSFPLRSVMTKKPHRLQSENRLPDCARPYYDRCLLLGLPRGAHCYFRKYAM